jgi:hypothetical protein
MLQNKLKYLTDLEGRVMNSDVSTFKLFIGGGSKFQI